MRITIAYNLRTDDTEDTAELLTTEDIERMLEAMKSLGHSPTPVEVSGRPDDVVDRLLASEPDLIFNVAEGTIGSSREAFYPGLYEQLRIPYSGGNPSLLHMNMDKHLAKTVLASRGVRVPRGGLVTEEDQEIPDDLQYPLIIKPNSEGSSKGISQESVVESREGAFRRVREILPRYPAGLVVEEFIIGKELSVPFLDCYPGEVLDIVEHTFDTGSKYNIYDYAMKQGGEAAKAVNVRCPADLTPKEERAVLEMSRLVDHVMSCPDMGRVDLRLHESGQPFFIELNPLPSLHPSASLMTAARVKGLSYREVIKLIIRSAAQRYKLALRPARKGIIAPARAMQRPTAREVGIRIGRFPIGVHNAITDVAGVQVGHWTWQEDNVQIPGVVGRTSVRTGVTAILPASGQAFTKRLVAGGFVLNGIGEMSGLTQVMEWGWLETPILLSNSHSVGAVHSGVIQFLTKKHPGLGTETDVVLPVVGEADDSFLNDVRVGSCPPNSVQKAINAASSGPVPQGSVGAGTGMMTFDFAGGIGTSSRVVSLTEGTFTVGVLVMSNFGRMRNLTIDGAVVGRKLDTLFDHEGRRAHSEGSIIVVIATDMPLLSSQLGRVAMRAALGLGRTGSYAAPTSGEILIAFSTANRSPRTSRLKKRFITFECLSDAHINPVYEAVIEATEEAVINAVFCSAGSSGRDNRSAPAIPHDKVLELLQSGRVIHESR